MDMSSAKAKPGYFHVFAGTEERYKLLRTILIRCNRGEFLLHDGTALNVFMIMLDDLFQSRAGSAGNPQPGMETNSASSAPSTTGATAIHLPDDFPAGETRRLVKLVVHLKDPELAPILNALRSHLEARTPDFPTAREGAQLIAYYLQPNLRDFAAALDVVRGLRDTNALPQEVVDDAIRDGKKFLSELESAVLSDNEVVQGRPSIDQLQQICLDVSLRLIAMKAVMAHRPKGGVQFRKALESLVLSFRLDVIDSQEWRRPDRDMQSLLDVPFRSIRSVLLHLIGQNDNSCLMEALFVLQRCDQRLVAMLPDRDLQEFCDAARSNGSLRIASETYAYFVKAKTFPASTLGMPINCRHLLARDGLMTDADTFLALMRELLSRGQKITIIALLRSLRLLPLTDFSMAQLNMRFSPPQRSRLIALLADVGSTDEAFALFQHWSHWQYDADSDSVASLNTGSNLREAGSVQVADPLIERQVRLMHDTDGQVAISARSLIALVRSFCHLRPSTPSGTPSASTVEHPAIQPVSCSEASSERFQKARFVIDVFRQACIPTDWTHYRLTALARACFIAQDVPGAFDALAKISFLRQIPDQVDVAVLLGGLIELDADKAVDLFIQHCSVPKTIGGEKVDTNGNRHAEGEPFEKVNGADADFRRPPRLAPMKPTSALASMLITRAIAQNRMDLVDKLYEFSKAVGISSRLGHTASLRAVFRKGVPPSKVTNTIHRMLLNGWPADPALLEILAQRLLTRSLQRLPVINTDPTTDEKEEGLSASRSKNLPPKKRLQLVQAATRLMQMSAGAMDVVNLRSVHRALDAIGGAKVVAATAPNTAGLATLREASESSLRSARRIGEEERRLNWIACLDSIVYMLRWTTFFDTGDDYQHSLPLWKSSNARDGELISADLDEMLVLGFGGKRRRQSRTQTKAGAATQSMAEEASVKAKDGTVDQVSDLATASTDGVLQNGTVRSPNVLPAHLYRRLIETYLVLGDGLGAAEVAAWMRDEANLDLAGTPHEASEFVDRIKVAVLTHQAGSTSIDSKQDEASRTSIAAEEPSSSTEAHGSNILRMLAGQSTTARTKPWWTPREPTHSPHAR